MISLFLSTRRFGYQKVYLTLLFLSCCAEIVYWHFFLYQTEYAIGGHFVRLIRISNISYTVQKREQACFKHCIEHWQDWDTGYNTNLMVIWNEGDAFLHKSCINTTLCFLVAAKWAITICFCFLEHLFVLYFPVSTGVWNDTLSYTKRTTS